MINRQRPHLSSTGVEQRLRGPSRARDLLGHLVLQVTDHDRVAALLQHSETVPGHEHSACALYMYVIHIGMYDKFLVKFSNNRSDTQVMDWVELC